MSFPRRGTPDSFGWVRWPTRDLDHHGWFCWERPDGAKVWMHERVGTLVQLLPSLPPQPDHEAARR